MKQIFLNSIDPLISKSIAKGFYLTRGWYFNISRTPSKEPVALIILE